MTFFIRVHVETSVMNELCQIIRNIRKNEENVPNAAKTIKPYCCNLDVWRVWGALYTPICLPYLF